MDSEPDIEFIEKDSGMSSLGGSKDETPERRAITDAEHNELGENYDDEPDETLNERLWGLTEMFPDRVRSTCGAVSGFTISTVKTLYNFSCTATWIFFTTSMILIAPVAFETERANCMESQKAQQKQVLLGPSSAAMAVPGGMPALPPMAPR
ncbi:Mitochondrial import receptor subunit TOM22 like [Pseudolycoriella hygida]|uniref:Mitochondrial import receptor subunit TOM22 homolog n=1 Tax=Pseudolycoriella hygida TaxID=35572 RepID=A0A9Q0RVE5_9DIPT|nr:Mitochondrial import receptor subunit TOM22 like [Pseudolycoriella hygida]